MQQILDSLFDKIYVVSLPSSTDRRTYIRKHFNDFGIQCYEFFDASEASAAEVTKAFSSHGVATFPQCSGVAEQAAGKMTAITS